MKSIMFQILTQLSLISVAGKGNSEVNVEAAFKN